MSTSPPLCRKFNSASSLQLPPNSAAPLRSGDFTQAFCQFYLPSGESYICCPPRNCPFTPPNTYLRLICTLYGLRRSPRHWYGKCTVLTPQPQSLPMALVTPFHYDLGHGCDTTLGGIKYVLCLVARNGRFLIEYPLQCLSDDAILSAVHQFVCDLGGRKPRRMIADRDFKLIGGRVKQYLGTTIDQPDDTGQAHAFGAPASRQDKNGLVEILWKFIITLARNWLTSNYLPKSFWYFAVRPATIVSNYMPLQLADRTWTSPFEQVYNVKPDW